MQDYQSLSHSRWDCKFHVVFIPKKRKKRIFGALRQHLGEIPGVGEAEGIAVCRRAPDGGSRTHVHQYSAEAGGIACSGLHQGQECYRDSEALRWS